MKKSFIKFIHQPKKVALVSMMIALVIGVFGYIAIHKKPTYHFATAVSGTIEGTSSIVNHLSLGFLSNGRIKTVLVKNGDAVKKDQVLATLDAGNVYGTLSQAEAAYETAKANYDKLVNGATGTDIDIAKTAVHTAEVNLDQTKLSQATLVKNAYANLLNSTPEAVPADSDTVNYTAPSISGIYGGDSGGAITITVFNTGGNSSFTASGLVNTSGLVSTTTPQPIGVSGLYIIFPASYNSNVNNWAINLPNKKAANYLANYNAYQAAVATESQVEATAQATLDQAQARLTQVVTAARPEDVAVAQAAIDNTKGGLEIAQAAYNNTIIKAPEDGTITSVSIAPGQIATPNTSAIELLVASNMKEVNVMIPDTALIKRDDGYYVRKQSGIDVVEQKVTVGTNDGTNVEILSGLAASDKVVIN